MTINIDIQSLETLPALPPPLTKQKKKKSMPSSEKDAVPPRLVLVEIVSQTEAALSG